MADYLVHKPVLLSAVRVKPRKEIEGGGLLARYKAMPKYDGCNTVIVLGADGLTRVISRVGTDILSLDRQAAALRKEYRTEILDFGGLVFFAEAWKPDTPHSEISGDYRRHSQSDLQLIVFDVVPQQAWEDGSCTLSYKTRRKLLREASIEPNPEFYIADLLDFDTVENLNKLAGQLMDHPTNAYDGLIAVDMDAHWTCGTGKDGEWLKIKRVLSFDLRVTEVHETVGAKTGRPVYTISVDFKGKTLKVGSGIPHDFANVPTVGQIVEVEAMDYSTDGLLREPRFKSIRYDKLEPDA